MWQQQMVGKKKKGSTVSQKMGSTWATAGQRWAWVN